MKEEKRKSERRAREERGRKRGRAREVRGRKRGRAREVRGRRGPLEPTGRCFHLSPRATKQLGRSNSHLQSSLGSRRPRQRQPREASQLANEREKEERSACKRAQ
ncbi:hypothetical protein KC19_2G111900 [Ceratodon purpureus]|uniref:Uncharacterized protein n=1 Tax=Ceratodon purpureus TaxID=3225 RepID=A0A8T0IUS1_CERPU|nr:hypothetical protein KC19_2G111900 [Ceratodon purpureus]